MESTPIGTFILSRSGWRTVLVSSATRETGCYAAVGCYAAGQTTKKRWSTLRRVLQCSEVGLDRTPELVHNAGMVAAALQQTMIPRLRDDSLQRRMRSGMSVLEESRAVVESVGPEQAGATVLLGYLAQWVDAGFDSPALIKRLLARFSGQSRIHLPLIEFLHLRIAEALVAMSEEDYENAVATLQFIDPSKSTCATPNFWRWPTSGRAAACAGWDAMTTPWALR